MIQIARSFVRAAGLSGIISPWLQRWENWKLSNYGALKMERLSPEAAQVENCAGARFTVGPPAHFAEMACSRHELPTMVACANICADLLKGGVAWDVGGNAGFYGAFLSQLVGPSGKVYGFEPVPDTFKLMCANLREAQCANVTPMNLALSDVDGAMPMSVDPADNTISSLELRVADSSVEVRVATGDRLVESGECEVPVMLKIDIEGHELKALKGMSGVLARSECRAVLCEIHFAILAAGGEPAPAFEAKKLLRAAGFKHCSFISRSHLMATK